MRKDLEQRLIESTKHGELGEQLLSEIMQDISGQLSRALNPIDCISAPFIVAALNTYANVISSQFSGCEEAARSINEIMKVAYLKIPVKGGGSQ
ncbi:hypothetical protein [Faecalispora anaeroviscerum]|uniref:hypothetical protein n=1 Tax=Faecalispora anaeroviscerum TaxID=2991836 RepID=UPI0024BA4279|nr:hypothetical protein [Faecalispora anaeroviscerum]